MSDSTAQRHLDHGPILSHHFHSKLHGSGRLGKINAAIAVRATSGLSSMWFFWFCFLLDAAELPAVISAGSAIAWVSYLSQTVIQLLALPLLGAGQQIISAQQDARAEADHAILAALHTLGLQQMAILRKLENP